MSDERDMTPAVGDGASPDFGAKTGEPVPLHQRLGDARWSYLYGRHGLRRARGAETRRGRERRTPLGEVAPGMMKAPVWTWEVPLYFWTGGIASGSAFVALACDLAGDHRSARIARLVSLGALAPSPPLLILDLGRPERFCNMLRDLQDALADVDGRVGADAVRQPDRGRRSAPTCSGKREDRARARRRDRPRRRLPRLLHRRPAGRAPPSRCGRARALFLGPIFVCTATATGAAATRLALVAASIRSTRRGSRCARCRRARWPPSSRSRWSTSAGSARTPRRCTAAAR